MTKRFTLDLTKIPKLIIITLWFNGKRYDHEPTPLDFKNKLTLILEKYGVALTEVIWDTVAAFLKTEEIDRGIFELRVTASSFVINFSRSKDHTPVLRVDDTPALMLNSTDLARIFSDKHYFSFTKSEISRIKAAARFYLADDTIKELSMTIQHG